MEKTFSKNPRARLLAFWNEGGAQATGLVTIGLLALSLAGCGHRPGLVVKSEPLPPLPPRVTVVEQAPPVILRRETRPVYQPYVRPYPTYGYPCSYTHPCPVYPYGTAPVVILDRDGYGGSSHRHDRHHRPNRN